MLKTLEQTNYENKTIIYRADYNVPTDKEGKIHDWQSWRIEATLPTLKKLIEKNCKIIVIAHFGRPDGKKDMKDSIKPAAKKLASYLKRNITTVTPSKPHKSLQKLEALTKPCYLLSKEGRRELNSIEELRKGEILFLENLRFHPGEKNAPSREFAQSIADLGDVYISDAFAAAHRKHASIYFLPQLLPSAAGPLLTKEDKILTRIQEDPQTPLYLVLGGAKVKTKVRLIESFLPKLKGVLLGGVIANAILATKGVGTGTSKLPEEIKTHIASLPIDKGKIHLPIDVKTAPSPKSAPDETSTRSVKQVPEDEMILDIGPKTIKLYKQILTDAEEIIWNGNLGLSEVPAFAKGSREIGQKISNSQASTIVGGGDTVAFLKKENLTNSLGFCSTGGGAMLEHLAGIKLPGIKILEK